MSQSLLIAQAIVFTLGLRHRGITSPLLSFTEWTEENGRRWIFVEHRGPPVYAVSFMSETDSLADFEREVRLRLR